jgi:hypothetical protein
MPTITRTSDSNNRLRQLVQSGIEGIISFRTVNADTGAPEAAGKNPFNNLANFALNVIYGLGYATGTAQLQKNTRDISLPDLDGTQIVARQKLDSVNLNLQLVQNPYDLFINNKETRFRIIAQMGQREDGAIHVVCIPIARFPVASTFETSQDFELFPATIYGEKNRTAITITYGELVAALDLLAFRGTSQTLTAIKLTGTVASTPVVVINTNDSDNVSGYNTIAMTIPEDEIYTEAYFRFTTP